MQYLKTHRFCKSHGAVWIAFKSLSDTTSSDHLFYRSHMVINFHQVWHHQNKWYKIVMLTTSNSNQRPCLGIHLSHCEKIILWWFNWISNSAIQMTLTTSKMAAPYVNNVEAPLQFHLLLHYHGCINIYLQKCCSLYFSCAMYPLECRLH